MSGNNVNLQNTISVKLLELRQHLKRCDQCRGALKAKDSIRLCEWSLRTIVEVAIRWDRNIPGRLAARNSKEPHVYPCPDPGAHGQVYALTAEACIVTAVQDGLI